MADVFSSALAARLLNKPVTHTSNFMDNLLPLVILAMSMTLIATFFIRRALEKGYGRRPKWARHSWKAFSALRRQLEASEVPALKSSWLQVVYEQEAKEVQEDDASLEEPRRKTTQRRGKRTSHVPAGRAGAPEAAEPTASELEEQPQFSSDSDMPEEAVVTCDVDASDEEDAAACDDEVAEEAEAPADEADAEEEEEEEVEVEEEEVEEAEQYDYSTPVPCTSEEEMIYSASLLMAHREIFLRIARGAPGLTKPEGCAPTTEDAADSQEAVKETLKEKSPKKAPQPAVHCTPDELQAMEPPMRKAKIVVDETDLTIYINADQSRYQIYRNGRELRSLAWGGSSTSRLKASWKKVLEMAAPLAARKGSADLLEP